MVQCVRTGCLWFTFYDCKLNSICVFVNGVEDGGNTLRTLTEFHQVFYRLYRGLDAGENRRRRRWSYKYQPLCLLLSLSANSLFYSSSTSFLSAQFPFLRPYIGLIFHDGLFFSEAFGYTSSLYKISTLSIRIYFKIATAAK